MSVQYLWLIDNCRFTEYRQDDLILEFWYIHMVHVFLYLLIHVDVNFLYIKLKVESFTFLHVNMK